MIDMDAEGLGWRLLEDADKLLSLLRPRLDRQTMFDSAIGISVQ